ncbi:phosphatase PAP2 family protein [Azotobacter beijerinckii]|nr:phosphatase PAP2 family protein [Azotobacter beijerinckii]
MSAELRSPNNSLGRKNTLGCRVVAGCLVFICMAVLFDIEFAIVFFISSIVGFSVLWLFAVFNKRHIFCSSWSTLRDLAFYLLVLACIAIAKSVLVPAFGRFLSMRSPNMRFKSFVTLTGALLARRPLTRLLAAAKDCRRGAVVVAAAQFLGALRARFAMVLVASLPAVVATPTYALSQESVGSFLATAMPLATLGTELYRGDREGAWQYALTFTTASVSTEVLKHVIHSERPDGSDNQSFPSGHATRAFSAAAYVRERHGLEAAAPLYVTALYVGYTRVNADRHRWADIAGAVLVAEVAAAWLVERAPAAQVTISPEFDRRFVGARFFARW